MPAATAVSTTGDNDVCRVDFAVSGMHCASCVSAIDSYVRSLDGIDNVNINLLLKRATVSFSPGKVTPKDISDAISELGYKAKPLAGKTKAGQFGIRIVPHKTLRNSKQISMLASSLRNTLNSLSGIKSFKLEIEVKSSSSPLELDMNPDSTVPDDVVVTSGVVATIEYTPEVVKRRQVLHILHSIAAASETPFDITLVGGQQAAEDRLSRRREIAHARNRFLISLAFAIPALFFGMIFMFIHEVEMHLMTEVTTGISISAIIQFIIATPVQFWLGAEFYVKTYKSLRRLRPTMEVLIALGTSAAYFYSIFSIILRMATGTTKVDLFFETSVLLICFLLLGRFLELLAKGRTSQAVGKLLSLQANDATVVVVDNATGEITSEETIEIDLLERGDLLKVLPGAKVPADGTVLIGDTMVDESMITGESLPVQKKAGSTVLGGTVNQQSMFLMKLTKTGTDTALSKIVQLVEDAQTQKAAIERVADKISSVFVPIVIGLAFATLAIWLIITGVGQQPPTWLPEGKSPFVFSLLFAIAVVVIACPCGIGLATPTAVMVGTGVAARHKVLIKGGNAMQKMSSVTAIVFDKTGTLTQGKPSLTDWEIFDTYSAEYSPSPSSPKRGHHKKERIVSAMAPEHFFLLVGAAESASEHPLGKAVALFAQEYLPASSLPFPTPTNVSALPGRGLVCNVSGSSVAIGNSRLMKQESISITKAAQARIDGLADQGKTPMIVAIDGKAIGLVAVSDPLRPEAAGVVAAMKKKGMHITIISGDNTRTVNFVAGQLGVADFYSQVLPKHKLKYVKKLQDSGHKVAMVGDGINDSPALAQADAGVAIGTGTDVAIEAADVVLMRSDLRDLLTAIDVAKRTYRRIWINFGWAFGYNVLAIPVAAGVFFPVVRIGLPPWIAGLAMALSSVSVVLSSLALRHYSPPKVTVATSNT